MKLWKRLLAVGMTIAMVSGLTACGGAAPAADSGAAPAAEGTAASSDIGEVTLIMSRRDEFLSVLEEGVKEGAEALGVKLNTQDAQSDINKQLQFVQTAANAGQKVCIVNLVDPATGQSIIDAAGDMKIVFVNRVPEDTGILNENAVYVGSDENTSGMYQGEYLAEYFKAKGKTDIKYIMINGILGQTSTTLRTESVLKTLKDNGINATEATAPLACEFDRATAMDQISPLLSSGLEFDCIICNNDAMALGVIEACRNYDIDPTSFPIVGIDATVDGRNAVKDGSMAMTVFQDAKGQGMGAVQAAINMIKGAPINENTGFELDAENPDIIWVPFEAVTAENAADYENR